MATVVEFGRRKGATKADLVNIKPEKAVAAVVDLLASEQPISSRDLKGTTRVTTNELQRIKDSITRFEREAAAREEEMAERLMMKEVSKEMAATWPNTLAGLHQQKISKIKEKERIAEEERREVDLEEAKFQAEKRKKLLEEARKLQYWQTDRVKGFHGAVLLSEVLRERQAQVEFKNRKSEEFSMREMGEAERMAQAILEAEMEEAKKATQRKKVILENKNFVLHQMDINFGEKVKAVEDDRHHGDTIWADVQDFLATKEMEKQDKKKKKLDLLVDNQEQLARREQHRQNIKEMNREELENIKKFAKAKQKMTKMTKTKERELFKIKQDAKEANGKALGQKYEEKEEDVEARLLNAIEEQEKKLYEEAVQKEAARQRALMEEAEHRQITMEEKAAAAEAAKEEERELISMRKQADQLFLENEKEKNRITGEENQVVNQYRKHQISMAAERKKKRHEEALAVDVANEDRMKKDEAEFQQYAKDTIKEKSALGCPTFPLERRARAGCGGGRGPVFEGKGDVRPSYMTADGQGTQLPCNGRTDTEYFKETVHGPAGSKNRLGFVWN